MISTYNEVKKGIVKEVKLSRKLNIAEKKYIMKWVLKYKYNFDVISIALSLSTNKGNPNFKYFNVLISDWYNRGLRTNKDIKNWINEVKKGKY